MFLGKGREIYLKTTRFGKSPISSHTFSLLFFFPTLSHFQVDMGMLSQLYFLVFYGQEMERHDGSAQFGYFLLVQVKQIYS
jgi:hypothetical protein